VSSKKRSTSSKASRKGPPRWLVVTITVVLVAAMTVPAVLIVLEFT
jgi:hypothetical protein